MPDTWADTELVTPDRVAAPVPSRVTAAVAIVPAADMDPVLQARHSFDQCLGCCPGLQTWTLTCSQQLKYTSAVTEDTIAIPGAG